MSSPTSTFIDVESPELIVGEVNEIVVWYGAPVAFRSTLCAAPLVIAVFTAAESEAP